MGESREKQKRKELLERQRRYVVEQRNQPSEGSAEPATEWKGDAGPLTRREIFERARAATVAFGTIENGKDMKILGSGVFVDPSGVIVTARHVLDGVDNAINSAKRVGRTLQQLVMVIDTVTVQTDAVDPNKHHLNFQYKGCAIQMVGCIKTHDLAVLKVKPPIPVTAMPVDYEADLREGDDIATCGFPYGAEMHDKATILSSFLTGIVSAVIPHPKMPPPGRYHYMLQLPVNPGNSGGAVFDPHTGRVIGIVSRRYQPGGIPAGLCVAEPIHQVRGAIAHALAQKIDT